MITIFNILYFFTFQDQGSLLMLIFYFSSIPLRLIQLGCCSIASCDYGIMMSCITGTHLEILV